MELNIKTIRSETSQQLADRQVKPLSWDPDRSEPLPAAGASTARDPVAGAPVAGAPVAGAPVAGAPVAQAGDPTTGHQQPGPAPGAPWPRPPPFLPSQSLSPTHSLH